LSKKEISELKAGSEEKVFIDFVIPENATKTSYSGKFQVTYDDGSSESEFILSILANEQNETTSEHASWFKFPSLPTGMFALPDMNILIIIVIIFVFSMTIILKIRKSRGGKLEKKLERVSIKNLLLDIKREIETRPLKKKK